MPASRGSPDGVKETSKLIAGMDNLSEAIGIRRGVILVTVATSGMWWPICPLPVAMNKV